MGTHFASRNDLESVDLLELLRLTPEEFRQRYGDTPMVRPGWAGLARNAALVLGNTAGPEALPALREALGHPEVMVREAAWWAIQEIEGRQRPE